MDCAAAAAAWDLGRVDQLRTGAADVDRRHRSSAIEGTRMAVSQRAEAAIQSRPHRRRGSLGGWSPDGHDDGGALAAIGFNVAERTCQGRLGNQRSVRLAATGPRALRQY